MGHPEDRSLLVLCGESVLSACQVARAYVQHIGLPRSVRLLCTSKVRKGAERLADFLRPSLACPLELHDIREESEAGDMPTAAEAYVRFEQEGPLAVNLSGGTKLMSITGLLALSRDDALFVQAGKNAFFVTWNRDGAFRTQYFPLPPPLSVEDMLRLQGIGWSPSTLRRGELRALCKEAGFPFPSGVLTDIAVGERDFDAVWNPGDNRVHLLVIRRNPFRDTAVSRLEETRDLLDIALGRKRLHQLFDRDIVVMEADRAAVERLELEGQGKLRVYPLGRHVPRASLKKNLESIFALCKPPGKSAGLPRVEVAEPQGSVLLLAVGPNPMPALLAMSAHKATDVLLCATPAVPDIFETARLLQEKAVEAGLGRVQILPCSPEGAELPTRIPALAVPTVVNITSGTKGQGAFLALWAKKYGHAVWSLEAAQGRTVCLSTPGQILPLPRPPLEVLLHCLSRGRMLAYGLSLNRQNNAWKKKRERFSDMLRFMRAVDDAGLWERFIPQAYWREPLEAGGFSLKFQNERFFSLSHATHGQAGSNSHQFTLKDGDFYETLAGQALAEADPQIDVRVNVTTRRESTSDERLTELDVVACARSGKLYVISCKNCPLDEDGLVAAAREVRSTARNLSRFAIPLLAWLYARDCRELEGVIVIGPDVLCRPDRLQRALDAAGKLTVT